MEKSQEEKQSSSPAQSSFTIIQKNHQIIVQYVDQVLFVKVIDSTNELEYYQGKFSHDNIPQQLKKFGDLLGKQSVIPILFQTIQQNPQQKISFDGNGNLILKLKVFKQPIERTLPLQTVKKSAEQLLLIKDQKIVKLTNQNNQLNETIKFLMQLNQDLQKQLLNKQAELMSKKQNKNEFLELQRQQKKIPQYQKENFEIEEDRGSISSRYSMKDSSQSEQENFSDIKKTLQKVQDNGWLVIGQNQVFQEKQIEQLLQLDINDIKQIHIQRKNITNQQFTLLFSKKWNNLTHIWMQGNKITNISNLKLQNLPKLQHISLHGNNIEKQSIQFSERLMAEYGRPTISLDKLKDFKVEDEDNDYCI